MNYIILPQVNPNHIHFELSGQEVFIALDKVQCIVQKNLHNLQAKKEPVLFVNFGNHSVCVAGTLKDIEDKLKQI
jgi:hypothetical protein